MQSQEFQLSQEQRLQQSLSPMQVRYFKMLEMSDAGMEEEVRRALDENPALDIADRQHDGDTDTFGETAEEMQLADYRSEDDIPPYRLEARNHSADYRRREPVAVAGGGSLMDSLRNQLSLLGLSAGDEAIGRYIIGNIDDNGYLTRVPVVMADDLTMMTGREVTVDMVNRVLDKVKTLDPAGVGAIDLRECLLLQLVRMEPNDTVLTAREIVSGWFDLFSKKHYQRILTGLGIAQEQLNDAVKLIRTLNPKPGGEVDEDSSNDRLRQVTPDFSVEPDPSGSLTVTLLSNVPELTVERTFAIDSVIPVKGRAASSARAFIKRQRDDALGFIKILKMRSETLMRVMSAIVSHQRRFFLSGDEAELRPMVLRDISNATGDDTSVVSRATAGKYVSTPWGIFPLKHFFNERFSQDAPDTSSREIMAALRAIIDGEDSARPLSDRALADALVGKGFDVARRTVTKYREQMAIPVARLRREP